MTFFVKLQWERQDRPLFRRVRSCTGEWSTAHDAIQELRERLLDLQNWRCAYCQVPIEADANGHREIEHILPKSASKDCTRAAGMSNDPRKRRSTLGYSEFTYEPKNLVVICKQCNTLKGTHDPLRNRSQARPISKYPGAGGFIWFHPHLHRYDEHIEINSSFVFSAITERGAAVIDACGLAKAQVLEKKFLARAMSRARQINDVKKCIEYLASSVEAKAFSQNDAEASISARFGLDAADAKALYTLVSTATSISEMESAERACQAVAQRRGSATKASTKAKRAR